MIVKRYWRGKYDYKEHACSRWCGWFLFGIIPLFIKQV